MKEPTLQTREAVRAAIADRDVLRVRQLVDPMHAADAAELLEALNPEESLVLFRFLQKNTAAELFSYLSITEQKELVSHFEDQELLQLIDQLYVDDATDLLEELPANAVRRILASAAPAKRALLNRYLHYPEDSAGSVMSEEFIRLRPEMSVKEAIRAIRNHRKRLASTALLYVTERDQTLVGVLSIRELLQAADALRVEEVMTHPVISARTTTDREEAIHLIRKYDFLALPIVDLENRLVGVITIDDALDISNEEATEDFEIMAAMQPTEKTYFEAGVLEQAKNRMPWLLILMFSGMISGAILGFFQQELRELSVLPFLITFVPMLTDTGGNAGSQSCTLIIRGLALGEIHWTQLPKVIWKEFRIACIVGVGLALFCAGRVLVFRPDQPAVALVVALAVFGIVLLSKIFGGAMPLIAKRLGLDPAVMSAPLITTVTDSMGLIIYFSLAQLIFRLAI